MLLVSALVGAGLALTAPVGLPGGGPLAASGQPALSSYVHVVRPGETLWSIATRAEPRSDPRPLVARLASETGGYSVRVGERIPVPDSVM